jgi:hypothetical protein
VVSTAPDEVSLQREHRARALRRAWVVLLCMFLAAGAFSLLGVHTREVSAEGDGYELTVKYADRSRPGLASPWSVEVRRDGGFDGPITLATTAAYFDTFDENGLDPEPTASTVSGAFLLWEFDPPEGDVLTVSFDARIEPSVQSLWPPEAITRLIVEDRRVVEVRYRTRVLP